MTKIYTIREINNQIASTIHQVFPQSILLKGEMQRPSRYANNSQYCDIVEKSDSRQYKITGVILGWENNNDIDLNEFRNQEVIITGYIDFYENTGNLQLKILNVERFGEGALKQKIEELKKKLAGEGIFNNARDIVRFPNNIGVITSEQGAVIHDVQVAIDRRYPISDIILYPTTVQGDNASKNIIKKIREANSDDLVDAILIVRGGGSFFDLLPFNDELLIREIYNSKIPIVTGIGHEPDITLADYAADKAMPTPTAAAEFVTPDKNEILALINGTTTEISIRVQDHIQFLTTKIKHLSDMLHKVSPKEKIANGSKERLRIEKLINDVIKKLLSDNTKEQNLSESRLQSTRFIINKFLKLRENQLKLSTRSLTEKKDRFLSEKRKDFSTLLSNIKSFDPKLNLRRGFSIIRSKNNEVIKKISSLKTKNVKSIELSDGSVKVKKIEIE